MKLLNLSNLKTNQTSAICVKCLNRKETFNDHSCSCEDNAKTVNAIKHTVDALNTNSITDSCSSSSSYPSLPTTYTSTYNNTNRSECYLVNNDKENLSITNLGSRFSNEKTMNGKLKNHRYKLNPTTNRSNSSNNLCKLIHFTFLIFTN